MCEVLIVDDDFMVARAHERIVAQTPGFTAVGVAHTGAQALDAIEALHPQLVLLDMYLPDMSGLDVIRHARHERIDVDFIVLSAAHEVDVVNQALQGGIVSYLLKPFKVDELVSRLGAYAERRRLLSNAAQVDQAVLDSAVRPARGGQLPLPKGLSTETSILVERLLDAADPDLAASEAAEQIGLSRVVVRRYLEYFVERGSARVSLRYGQAGRPQRRYSKIG